MRNAVDGRARPCSAEAVDAVAVTERNAHRLTRSRVSERADNLELVAQLDRKLTLLNTLTAEAPGTGRKRSQRMPSTYRPGMRRAADFERAWNWSRAHAWVTRLAAPDSEQQHRLEFDATETSPRLALLRNSPAERAWAHCFDHMTDDRAAAFARMAAGNAQNWEGNRQVRAPAPP